MDQDILKKVNQVIADAKSVAIVFPENLNLDQLCAVIALQAKLTGDNKSANLFSSAKSIPETLFLSHQETVHSSFSNTDELVIKVKGDQVKPAQLRYEKQNDDLLIYVSPQEGKFSADQVEVLPSIGDVDLFVILGAATLEELGSLYENNVEKFFNTAKVTISNNINQEYFANLTWVELEASSLCEQFANWFGLEVLQKKDDLILTSLLAGIIKQTSSFRDPKTTPESLAVAANLVKYGARQQDIIQYLFKTKPFQLLQLWGRALARIKTAGNSLLYTILTAQDFEKTGTRPSDNLKVLEEIMAMANGYQIMAIISEQATGVEIVLAAKPHINLVKMAKTLDLSFNGETEPFLNNSRIIRLAMPTETVAGAEQKVSQLN